MQTTDTRPQRAAILRAIADQYEAEAQRFASAGQATKCAQKLREAQELRSVADQIYPVAH